MKITEINNRAAIEAKTLKVGDGFKTLNNELYIVTWIQSLCFSAIHVKNEELSQVHFLSNDFKVIPYNVEIIFTQK